MGSSVQALKHGITVKGPSQRGRRPWGVKEGCHIPGGVSSAMSGGCGGARTAGLGGQGQLEMRRSAESGDVVGNLKVGLCVL